MSIIIKNFFKGRVKLIKPKIYKDNRGFFFEGYNKKLFVKKFIKDIFVQDNYSYSKNIGTIRGLHFQIKPMRQSKLIYVSYGAVFDVVVDINKKSNTYGKFQTFILNSSDRFILYVSDDFAHGFCSIKQNTLLHYKVSKYYSNFHERTIIWNDPDLNIPWPKVQKKYLLSKKDSKGLLFRGFNI